MRLALVVMVTGLVLTRSRMGNVAFLLSLTGVGCFYLLAVRKVSRRTIAFFASLLIIDLLVIGNFFGIEKVAERIQQTTLETEDRVNTNRDARAMLQDFPIDGDWRGKLLRGLPHVHERPELQLYPARAQRLSSIRLRARPRVRRRAGLCGVGFPVDGHPRAAQATESAHARRGLCGDDGDSCPADSLGDRFQPADSRQCSAVRRHVGPCLGQPLLRFIGARSRRPRT